MHYISTYSPRKELVLFDNQDPKALCNVLPEAFTTLVRHLYDSENGFLLSLAESQLKSELNRRMKPPTSQDTLFRYRFWCEYHAMLDNEIPPPRFFMGYVIQSDMSKEAFYKHYLTQPEKVAWILCQPQDYRATVRDALMRSAEKMLEILEIPFQDKDGATAIKVIEKQIVIYEKLTKLFLKIGADKADIPQKKETTNEQDEKLFHKKKDQPSPVVFDEKSEEDWLQKIEALKRGSADDGE